MLVVKDLYHWGYAQSQPWVSDSLVLGQFCRVYLEPAPDDTTLIRWANCKSEGRLKGKIVKEQGILGKDCRCLPCQGFCTTN